MKIYTKKGDKGETSLIGGRRTSKSALRIEAYGEVDELNAGIGAARAFVQSDEVDDILLNVQRDLFTIGAMLADPDSKLEKKDEAKSLLRPQRLADIEAMIDTFQSGLKPLRHFILPSGTKAGVMLHLARGICRRAERRVVALDRGERVPSIILEYVNRLSDFLFVLARVENKLAREDEWGAPSLQ